MEWKGEESRERMLGRFRHEGREIQGIAVELTAESALLDLPGEDPPRLPIGADVTVLFSGGPLRTPLEVSCRLVYRGEGEGICRLRMRLDPEEGAAISNLLSRRGAYRVVPIAESPVPVQLWVGSERSVEAVIKDLSRTGMGVLVPLEDEEALYEAARLVLRFRLPGIEDLLEIPGVVRYRSLVGSAIQYGVEFTPANATEFARIEEKLTTYTMRCQAEILRRLRVRRGA